jgi:hypothetical protein
MEDQNVSNMYKVKNIRESVKDCLYEMKTIYIFINEYKEITFFVYQ